MVWPGKKVHFKNRIFLLDKRTGNWFCLENLFVTLSKMHGSHWVLTIAHQNFESFLFLSMGQRFIFSYSFSLSISLSLSSSSFYYYTYFVSIYLTHNLIAQNMLSLTHKTHTHTLIFLTLRKSAQSLNECKNCYHVAVTILQLNTLNRNLISNRVKPHTSAD